MDKVKVLREAMENYAKRRYEIEQQISRLKLEHKMLGEKIAHTEDKIDDLITEERRKKNG